MKKFTIVKINATHNRGIYNSGIEDNEGINNCRYADVLDTLHMDLELINVSGYVPIDGGYIINFKDDGKVEVKVSKHHDNDRLTYYYSEVLMDSEFAQSYLTVRATFYELITKDLYNRNSYAVQETLTCKYTLDTKEYGRITTEIFPD